MTPRTFALSLSTAACVFIVAAELVLAGQTKDSKLRAWSGAGSVFQIEYPQNLVRCEHLDAENPDVWSPEGACAASIAVCDSSGHAGNVLACLAYPPSEFHGSELQAAAFTVSRIDSFHTASDCLQRWGSPNTSAIHAEQIRGAKFQAAMVKEAEGNYVAEHAVYRTFHKDACYELDVNLSTALDTAFAAEDKPRKLTAAERQKIKGALTQALEGFRFQK
jgi:hypothetical protein